jgi:hypothetical protein
VQFGKTFHFLPIESHFGSVGSLIFTLLVIVFKVESKKNHSFSYCGIAFWYLHALLQLENE